MADVEKVAATDTAEAEPHRAEFVPHAVSGERREAIVLDPAGYDPGEEDPEMSDALDEGLARALPGDDDAAVADLPLSDFAQEDTAFPLLDADPMDAPDNETGDVEDEIRLEDEAAADEAVVYGRVK